MTRAKTKCKHYIMLFFVVAITYLVSSLYYDFKYLDLGYLVVVVVGLIRFLIIKDKK